MRALRKRHGASFLAAARRLLQSIKIFHTDCFAKGKNKSLFLRHKNPTIFVMERKVLRNQDIMAHGSAVELSITCFAYIYYVYIKYN